MKRTIFEPILLVWLLFESVLYCRGCGRQHFVEHFLSHAYEVKNERKLHHSIILFVFSVNTCIAAPKTIALLCLYTLHSIKSIQAQINYRTRTIKGRRHYSKNMFLTLRLSHRNDINDYF